MSETAKCYLTDCEKGQTGWLGSPSVAPTLASPHRLVCVCGRTAKTSDHPPRRLAHQQRPRALRPAPSQPTAKHWPVLARPGRARLGPRETHSPRAASQVIGSAATLNGRIRRQWRPARRAPLPGRGHPRPRQVRPRSRPRASLPRSWLTRSRLSHELFKVVPEVRSLQSPGPKAELSEAER